MPWQVLHSPIDVISCAVVPARCAIPWTPPSFVHDGLALQSEYASARREASEARSAWNHKEKSPVPAGRFEAIDRRVYVATMRIQLVLETRTRPIVLDFLEGRSPYFLCVSVLCPAGATGLSPGIYPWELPPKRRVLMKGRQMMSVWQRP